MDALISPVLLDENMAGAPAIVLGHFSLGNFLPPDSPFITVSGLLIRDTVLRLPVQDNTHIDLRTLAYRVGDGDDAVIVPILLYKCGGNVIPLGINLHDPLVRHALLQLAVDDGKELPMILVDLEGDLVAVSSLEFDSPDLPQSLIALLGIDPVWDEERYFLELGRIFADYSAEYLYDLNIEPGATL